MLKMSWKSAEKGKPAEERKSGTPVTEANKNGKEEAVKNIKLEGFTAESTESGPIASIGRDSSSSSSSS